MASVPLSPHAHAPRWLLPAVIVAHGAALVALVRPPDEPVTPPRPLTVALLAPPAPPAPPVARPEAPPPPKPKAAPRPKPLPRPATKPEPAITAAPAAPAQEAVPEPAVPAPAPVPSPAPAAAEAPLEAARYDAAYLRNPPPPYPPLSRRLGEQGKVQLRVHVNTEGLPTAVEIKSSSGSPRLDEAALETVRKWRFVPARQGDRPVAAWVVVPINFRLEG
ncbi:MAG: energy transducer TonB [Pseudomonadota bacterium]